MKQKRKKVSSRAPAPLILILLLIVSKSDFFNGGGGERGGMWRGEKNGFVEYSNTNRAKRERDGRYNMKENNK